MDAFHLTDQETLRGNVQLIREVTHCFLSFLHSFLDYRHGHNPWAPTLPFPACVNNSITPIHGTIKAVLHPPLDLSLRGELRGQKGPGPTPISIPVHRQALATLIPDPFYTLCVPLFYTDAQFPRHTHTLTHAATLLSPSSRQKHGIVSHIVASSCAWGAMWGAPWSKQRVGAG